ncbi:MAG: hypothetical protein JWO08_1326 [Verrucomicrobiaceae bacterium]|nr:hypothetical protein [Verrucomicrobiaceae bacterium]
MRLSLLVLSLCACCCLSAADVGDFNEDTDLLMKISKGVTTSKREGLTPRIYSHNGSRFSYFLSSISYLGTIEHGKEKALLATVEFVRSSAERSIYPSSWRSHSFLVCLTANFKLKEVVSLIPGHLYLNDGKLMSVTKCEDGLPTASEQIADFTVFNERTRSQGFPIEGNGLVLEYPFSDRIEKPKDSAKP